jgi:hypothetical protein
MTCRPWRLRDPNALAKTVELVKPLVKLDRYRNGLSLEMESSMSALA